MAPPLKFHPDRVGKAVGSSATFPTLDAVGLVKTLSAHVQKTYELDHIRNRINFSEPWRNLKELPSSEEINPLERVTTDTIGNANDTDCFEETPEGSLFLPYNRIDSSWDSKAQYIGTHYQLIREDGIAPLRSAVSVFKESPDMYDSQDVCVYTNVHIIGYTISMLGPAVRVEFSFERAGKRIRWDQSSRLKQGTIVAITPKRDCFRTVCKVAVVAARPMNGLQQNPPQIDLFWASPEDDAEFDPLEPFTMIEARTGYFEFNRHMLVAMQKLMTERFPMEEHLVSVGNNIGPPAYVKNHPVTNLNALVNTSSDSVVVGNSPQSFDFLDNIDILNSDWPEIPESSLDRSQMQALKRMLTKKIAIVQGPPGTGKTFVSVSALRVMLDNWVPGDPPLIIAAQTNHALDQLLTHILPFEKDFVRLGGRTNKENKDIIDRTLYEIRLKNLVKLKDNYRSTRRAVEETAKKFIASVTVASAGGIMHPQTWFARGLITKKQLNSLHDDEWASAPDPGLPQGPVAQWLGRDQIIKGPVGCPPINMGFLEEETDVEFEQLAELETEVNKDDDDIDTLSGEWIPVIEEYAGKPSPGFREDKVRMLLSKKQNLWEIPVGLRGEVYRFLQRQIKKDILSDVRFHAKEYMKKTENLKIAKWEKDANLITALKVKIIGCTTTGLSKYRGFLAALSPRILLIEEAAETLEGTVLAAMFESLEHLVLVGDHKQLRAQCSYKFLEKDPYSLSISMFERLVNCGVEYTMLNEQRRMIPEIRELLSQEGFYEQLKDHSSVTDRVTNRKPVPGMGGRDSLIFHHTWPESRDDAASRYNIDEAEMIVGFFRYLVLNGVDYSSITVLTYYNGQRTAILRLLKRSPDLQSATFFKVFTVDSYQGEENDIVLLSLVRSNDYNQIGFLDSRNRAVVALSRARRGLYVFGNIFNLIDHSKESQLLWGAIFRKMVPDRVVQTLPITCVNHGKTIEIGEPGDWDIHGVTGGCDIECNGFLPCGHKCPHRCHPFSHDDVLCKEPCPKILSCGHKCEGRCGDHCYCECSRVSTQGQNDKCAENDNTQEDLSKQWKGWDARKADAEAELRRLTLKPTTPSSSRAAPQYLDTHRPVDIIDGVRNIRSATQKLIVPSSENYIDSTKGGNTAKRELRNLPSERNTPPVSTRGQSPDLLINIDSAHFGPTPANSSRTQSPRINVGELTTVVDSALSPLRGSFEDDDDEHIFAGIQGDRQDILAPSQLSNSEAPMVYNSTAASQSAADEELLIDFGSALPSLRDSFANGEEEHSFFGINDDQEMTVRVDESSSNISVAHHQAPASESSAAVQEELLIDFD